jgi:hypothetical protein
MFVTSNFNAFNFHGGGCQRVLFAPRVRPACLAFPCATRGAAFARLTTPADAGLVSVTMRIVVVLGDALAAASSVVSGVWVEVEEEVARVPPVVMPAG